MARDITLRKLSGTALLNSMRPHNKGGLFKKKRKPFTVRFIDKHGQIDELTLYATNIYHEYSESDSDKPKPYNATCTTVSARTRPKTFGAKVTRSWTIAKSFPATVKIDVEADGTTYITHEGETE